MSAPPGRGKCTETANACSLFEQLRSQGFAAGGSTEQKGDLGRAPVSGVLRTAARPGWVRLLQGKQEAQPRSGPRIALAPHPGARLAPARGASAELAGSRENASLRARRACASSPGGGRAHALGRRPAGLALPALLLRGAPGPPCPARPAESDRRLPPPPARPGRCGALPRPSSRRAGAGAGSAPMAGEAAGLPPRRQDGGLPAVAVRAVRVAPGLQVDERRGRAAAQVRWRTGAGARRGRRLT